VVGMTGTHHHAWFIGGGGVVLLFTRAGLEPRSSQSLLLEQLGLQE
jgi:hypothetical protein